MSWYSKKQHTILRSSIEAEYRNLTNIGAKIALWFSLLRELNIDIHKTLVVWYDNLSTIMLAANLDLHAKTKRIELDLYLVREKVSIKELKSSIYLHFIRLLMWSQSLFQTLGFHYLGSNSKVELLTLSLRGTLEENH